MGLAAPTALVTDSVIKGKTETAHVMTGLVTLNADYHYNRIFSSWMDGSLLHLQACRTQPSSSLAWSRSPLLTTTSGCSAFGRMDFFCTCKHVGYDRPRHWPCHAHRSLSLHQDLQLFDGWLSFAPAGMSDTAKPKPKPNPTPFELLTYTKTPNPKPLHTSFISLLYSISGDAFHVGL